jgi:hypothetical protein
MSSEVRSDDMAMHKKKFPIVGPVLFLVLAVAILANFAWNTHRNQKAQTSLFAWTNQLKQDNPSIVFSGFTISSSADLLGGSFQYQSKFKTPTGRPMVIDFNFLGRPFSDSGGLVLSAEGKSLTLPLEDVERGRKIDLKAEFPEAFR